MSAESGSNSQGKKSPYFKKREIDRWCGSIILILLSFLIFDRSNYMTLIASLIGVTSLIFCAKGNPVGQVLMILFSILYGIISYGFAYDYLSWNDPANGGFLADILVAKPL